ncbi:MAG TPA: polyprenyl synthetase family protein [Dehalococcoidia bacterium]|nr:polyprenyl synthetase family protein [Dehalococcoidia bacterium]
MDAPDFLSRYRAEVENEVARVVPSGPSPLYEMVRYQLGWTDAGRPMLGKCIRPSLCLFAAETLGGSAAEALPVAVGIELLHNFSLVHDDIEDGDELRHHRPTVWKVYGRRAAVMAGMALWTLAYRTLEMAADRGAPPERVREARRTVALACNEMIEGQHMDLTFEQRGDVSLAEYTAMISRKTGALFAAALATGAIMAGAGSGEAEKLARFGRELGLAFQIRDDILGIWGEGTATGKPVGADIAKRKKSLPVVHAFQQVVGPDRDILRNAYSKPEIEESDIDDVLDVLQRWNARYFAQGLAEDHRAKAMAALAQTAIPPSARFMFDELTAFILEREF